jgi:hypothetical protein
MNLILVPDENGEISYTATFSSDSDIPDIENAIIFKGEIPEISDLSCFYVKDGILKEREKKYNDFLTWNKELEEWVPDLYRARVAKKQEIETVLKRKLYEEPCNGFDADMVSRSRISGLLQRLQRGDGLPSGWIGWRDASNNMHWSLNTPEQVYSYLSALSLAIEDKEQAMLLSAWMHKKNIDDSNNLEYILSYPVEEGW